MPITTRRLRWRRWTGLHSDLVHAARYASGWIQEWAGPPDENVEIVFKGDRSIQGTVDDLAAVDPRDLQDIREVSIRIDQGDDRPVPGISIRARRDSPALTVQLRGEDQAALAGARAELEEILDRGKPRIGWWETYIGAFLGLIAFFGGMIGGIVLIDSVDIATWIDALIVIGLFAFPFLLGGGLIWLFPHLQILEAGGHPRFHRFRIWVYAFVFAVLTSLIASLIWAVVAARE